MDTAGLIDEIVCPPGSYRPSWHRSRIQGIHHIYLPCFFDCLTQFMGIYDKNIEILRLTLEETPGIPLSEHTRKTKQVELNHIESVVYM